jgi:type II secretory pathway component PulF
MSVRTADSARSRTPSRAWRRTTRPITRGEAAAAVARLAALTGAGVSTGDALASSARSGNRLLVRLHSAVRRGTSLSNAMAGAGLPFTEAEVAVVRAGERGGSTARVLALLAERMEREAGGRRRLASALAYPLLLLAGAAGALAFLSIAVLPSFTSLYAGHQVELPLATRSLLAFGQALSAHGLAFLATAGAVVLAFAVARRRVPSVARAVDRVVIDTPPLRAFAAPAAAHDCCSLLGLLLDAGCEAEEALTLAVRATPNRIVAARLAEALRALRRGIPLSRGWAAASLDRSGHAEPLLEIAEATGGYGLAFARVAALEGAAAEQALAQACRLAEPAAVVTMAVAVGGGVLALYQPMLGSASLLLGGNP